MITTLIMDCFGVIRVEAIEIAYRRLGGDPEQDRSFIAHASVEAHSGRTGSVGVAIAERLGTTPEIWQDTVQSASTIDFDVLNFVRAIRRTHKTGLLSNMRKGGLSVWFDPGFLDQYFDVAVSSGDIGYAKPDARAYLAVCQLLDEPPANCVFVDDKPEYVEGATRAGMKGLHFTGLRQLKADLEALLNTPI